MPVRTKSESSLVPPKLHKLKSNLPHTEIKRLSILRYFRKQMSLNSAIEPINVTSWESSDYDHPNLNGNKSSSPMPAFSANSEKIEENINLLSTTMSPSSPLNQSFIDISSSDKSENDYMVEIMAEDAKVMPLFVGPKSDVVSSKGISLMEEGLPSYKKGYNWIMLFSSFRHGANYIPFYEKLKFEESTYVIIETMSGEIFGGFASTPWHESKGQYYGTGECFLFKLNQCEEPSNEFAPGSDRMLPNFKSLSKYMWTGMNTFFQIGSVDGFGLGGGGDHFGFYVGEDFAYGSSGNCVTFDNEPLCSIPYFEICQVEVWGFTQATTEVGVNLEKRRKMLKQKSSRRSCRIFR